MFWIVVVLNVAVWFETVFETCSFVVLALVSKFGKLVQVGLLQFGLKLFETCSFVVLALVSQFGKLVQVGLCLKLVVFVNV